MARRISLALTLVIAALVVTATPTLAANTAVGSVHTSDTDFADGTLTNMSVEGSGDSASVVFDPVRSSSTYTTTGGHSATVPANADAVRMETWGAAGGGSNGGAGGYASGVYPVSGGESLNINVGGEGSVSFGGTNGGGDGGFSGDNDQSDGYGGGGASDIRVGGSALADRVIVGGGGGGAGSEDIQGGGAGGAATAQDGDDGLETGGGGGGTQASGGSGGAGADGGNAGASGSLGTGGEGGEDTGPDGAGGGGGGGGYYGGGGGGAHGNNAGRNYRGGGGGGGSNYLAGSLTKTESKRGVQSGDGKVSVEYLEYDTTASYISDRHNVTDATSGWTDLQLNNAEATVTWQGYDGVGWVDLASATYTTTGNKSLALPGGYDAYRVNVSINTNPYSGTPTATIDDEGVQFQNESPIIDNTSATPSGGTTVNTANTDLSVPVTDPTFATVQNDSVNVSFYVDGDYLAHDTLTSNGTASVPLSGLTGGSHDWYARANDSYAASTRSDADSNTAGDQNFTFSSPSELSIYNESNATELVDSAEVSLLFYYNESGDTTIINKTTNDGTVSFDDLPVGREFVVVADADGYTQRRIYVDSLIERNSIYLLPDAKASNVVEFDLQDFTGRYPQDETVLKIQRGLNGTYRTVEADFFGGAGEFPTTLRTDARHRLVVLNTETGREKVLGSYTPVADTTEEIKISRNGTISIADGAPSVQVQPSLRSLRPTDSESISVDLDSNSATITDWRVVATYRNESTTVEVANLSRTTDGGSLSATLPLTNRSGGNVTVVVSYTTANGTTTSADAVVYAVRASYNNQYALLSVLGTLPTYFPDQHADTVTTLLAVLTSILVAGAVGGTVRVSSEVIGLAALLPLAGFALIGWVGYGPVFIGGVAWVGLAALQRGI